MYGPSNVAMLSKKLPNTEMCSALETYYVPILNVCRAYYGIDHWDVQSKTRVGVSSSRSISEIIFTQILLFLFSASLHGLVCFMI